MAAISLAEPEGAGPEPGVGVQIISRHRLSTKDVSTNPRTQFDHYMAQVKTTSLLSHTALIQIAREAYIHRYEMMRILAQFPLAVEALVEQYGFHAQKRFKLSGFATGIVDQSVKARDDTLALNRQHGKGQHEGETQSEEAIGANCLRLKQLTRSFRNHRGDPAALLMQRQMAEGYILVALRVEEFERHCQIFESITSDLRCFADEVFCLSSQWNQQQLLDSLCERTIQDLAEIQPEEDREAFIERASETMELAEVVGIPLSEALRLRRMYDHHKEEHSHCVNGIVQANLLLSARETLKQKPDDDRLFDVCQEANQGLIIAASRFSYWKDLAFSTYAVWWIRQRLIRHRDQTVNGAFSIPCSVVSRVKKIYQVRERHRSDYGEKDVSSAQIASEIGCSRALVDEAMQAYWPLEDTDDTNAGLLAEHSDVFEETALESLREVVREALQTLPERKRAICELRWGMSNDDPLTLAEISSRFGMTKEGVRKVEQDALATLRRGSYASRLEEFYRLA